MARPRKILLSLLTISGLLAGGMLVSSCSLERRLSAAFLHPTTRQVATPADLGLPFEDVLVTVDAGISLHGWFLPAADAQGRTVVLCHGSSANISFLHPYYRFLHEAGFNVFLFDYRGYGRSGGEPSIGALLTDLAIVDGALRERADVTRVAYYGISLGSILALRAGTGDAAGVVVENAISAARMLRRQSGALTSWYLETFVLPAGIECTDSASLARCPVFLIEGEREGATGFQGHMDTWANLPVDRRSMWVMPDTGHAPHSLLVFDGHYQDAVVAFLRGCFEGDLEQLTATVEAGGTGRVVVRREGGSDDSRRAVQLCVVPEDGALRFVNVWMEGDEQVFELAVGANDVVSATRYRDVIDGDPWQPRETELMRAGRIWQRLEPAVTALLTDPEDLAVARHVAGEILAEERDGAFHPLLEAHLAASYATIGQRLWSVDRAAARGWLQRCVASRPDEPALAYWPGRPYVAGFPAEGFVQRAEQLLAEGN